MQRSLIPAILLFLSLPMLRAQQTDTLTFYSPAFGEPRSVIVVTPEFYKYQSEAVRLPVFYVLDGQHEWFVNPVLNTVRYLQYTHEIPGMLIVIIPHHDRIAECDLEDIHTQLPLDVFLTEELEEKIQRYNPGKMRIITGHSFSASFALHTYLKHPDRFAAVIAHSPLDQLADMIAYARSTPLRTEGIYLSVGGIAADKDYYHRKEYNRLKSAYLSVFADIHTFEADLSAHNAVPVVATPSLLTGLFASYRSRYTEIAGVDEEYVLIDTPGSVQEERDKILSASRLRLLFDFPPEIADVNGIASRYESNGYLAHARMVYEFGLQYYPDYYEFCLSLYELLLPTDPEEAKLYLNRAIEQLQREEPSPEHKDLLKELLPEKQRHGW